MILRKWQWRLLSAKTLKILESVRITYPTPPHLPDRCEDYARQILIQYYTSEIFINQAHYLERQSHPPLILKAATSALNAIQVKMSSIFNCGYSCIISSLVLPLASRSRIGDTQIRIPFMHDLPWQMLGFTEIWSFQLNSINTFPSFPFSTESLQLSATFEQ